MQFIYNSGSEHLLDNNKNINYNGNKGKASYKAPTTKSKDRVLIIKKCYNY